MYKSCLKILIFYCPVLLAAYFPSSAQKIETGPAISSLPGDYFKIGTDTGRMRFLVRAISDSLDEGQLNHILDWSRIGLVIAEKNNADTMKGIFLFDIGKAFAYKYLKYDSAIFYYKKVIPFFPDKMKKYNVYTVREIMDRYADMGNKDSSFSYLDKLKALIDTMPLTSAKRITLSQNIANVYKNFGMYKTAIRYFQTAINGNREKKNFRSLGLALANLGELYNEINDNEKAIQYSKEALVFLTDVNMPYMQTAGNIGGYYSDQMKFDSALVYLKKSEEVAIKINDFETRLANQNRLAGIYIAQKNFSGAKLLLDRNLLALSTTDDRWNLCKTLLNYANLDAALQNYAQSKAYLQRVLLISGQNEFKAFTVTAFQQLSAVCSKLGDYRNAFDYHTQYVNLRDSIADEKTKSELADLEISYKTQQKEQEILLLKKDNDIKNLQLANNKRSVILYLVALVFTAALFSVLFYQRAQRNKVETKKIKAELENQVLRLQMNPHFIFNSLNSIENFMMQNEKRLASDYLTKFSKLIRSILDSSLNEWIPVSKDMEALQWYVDLQQLRLNNKFSYHTDIDGQLLQGDYKVPSMLIQPFVENAIEHGVAHSEKSNLKLTVTVSLENDYIIYTIEDNGIGRQRAAEYNRQNKPYHKSVGVAITTERVNIFNKEQKSNVQTTDLYDIENKPAGTRVTVKIKLQ